MLEQFVGSLSTLALNCACGASAAMKVVELENFGIRDTIIIIRDPKTLF